MKHVYLILMSICFFAKTSEAQVYATVPYTTGFESGIDASWTTWSSLSTGEVATFLSGSLVWSTETAYSHTGNYFLGMHHTTAGSGAYNTNQANLHLNLAGQSNLRFSFWWAEWNDETEATDGIYVSNNGGASFVKVKDLNGASYIDLQWSHFDMSLDSINTVHGLTFTSNYIIRLQQYDNYYFAGGNDGFLFDDINVYNICNTSSTISPVACDQYVAPDSQTYTSSGVYTAVIPNTAGCDSVITINLTINQSASSSTINTACDSYTWTDGMTYTASGVYSQTLQTSAGCDSIAELVLTINPSTDTTFTVTALDSYTLNSQTYVTSGMYQQTLINQFGCDSIINLNLTLNYTGLEENSLSGIAAFPNPASEVITLSGDVSLVDRILLLDAQGRLVSVFTDASASIDLRNVRPGLYYLQLESGTIRKSLKFTLSR